MNVLKLPYLYYQAWRTWRAQRANLTRWGRCYDLPAPADDETNEQYRRRVYAAISHTAKCVGLVCDTFARMPLRVNHPVSSAAHELFSGMQARVDAWRAAGGIVNIVQDSYTFEQGAMTDEKFKELQK